MKKILFILITVLTLGLFTSCNNTSGSKVKVIDIKLTDENYAYVVKKGNVELVDSFNTFLNEIKSDGTFDEIVAKYFEGIGEKKGVDFITSLSTINDENTFVVATNCPFSPFEYIDSDGKMYGIDVEIAQLYAKSQNMELVVKNIDFDAIFTNVDSNYADIGMAGITINEERLGLYDFTNTYYAASQKLVVLESNTTFDDCKTVEDVESILKSLEDENIGFQIGTTGNWYVAGDEGWGFDGFSNVSAKGYKTAQLAIQDIINGQLYGVVVDEAPGNDIVEAINELSSMNWAGKLDVFLNAVSQESNKELIKGGLINTLLIAVLGLVIGVVIGTIIAIIKVTPKKNILSLIASRCCTVYVAIFRGTPMVVQLLITYYVLMPTLGIAGVKPLTVGIIVFGLNSGAYVSEIMRGGINSIDKGQLEAARALGLSYKTSMIKIVVPQAIKNILPTIGNEFITLIKETSVVSFITVIDLYTAFNTIGTNSYSVVIPYIMMAIIYIVLVLIITILVKILEKGLAKSDRGN